MRRRHARIGVPLAALLIAIADVAACTVAIEEPPRGTATGTGAAAGAGAGASVGTGAGGCGPSYAEQVLCDHPVGYWRLDDGDVLSALDSSMNGHPGGYSGSVELREAGALEGEPENRAAYFGGGMMQLTADTEVLDFAITHAFTLEAWIKPDVATSSEPAGQAMGGVICGKASFTEADGYRGYFWVVMPPGDGGPGSFLRLHRTNKTRPPETAESDTLQSDESVPPEVFTHVVTRFDGNEARHYFNGIEVGVTQGQVEMPGVDEPFRIGYITEWGANHAVIDELAVYDYALPLERIQAHYALGSGNL